MDSTVCKLWVHNERFSQHDVIIHADLLPGLQPGQLLELRPVNASNRRLIREQTDGCVRLLERRLIIVYEAPDPEIMRKQPQLQISLNSQITTAFELPNWSDVTIAPVEADIATSDFALLTFRDQYLGRSDMWRLRLSLIGKAVYVGQKILFAGCIRAQVKEIYISGKPRASGLVGENTRVIFRSESAKFFILIQMSQEMWEFDEDGVLFNEKMTYQFLPELFRRWAAIEANHVVCIVLFTRVQYDTKKPNSLPCPGSENRWYRDFYKVLVDWETRKNWSEILPRLKCELIDFKRSVLVGSGPAFSTMTGRLSMAREGNILEAIGLALNTFDRHYVDRDLLRTGQAIMVVTPCAGFFEVEKKLLRLTSERMFDSGIALDLVCLGQIPLHAAPLFRFLSATRSPPDNSATTIDGSDRLHMRPLHQPMRTSALASQIDSDPLQSDDVAPMLTEEEFFAWPHWVVASYFCAENMTAGGSSWYTANTGHFSPTCRMPSVQPFNILANEISLVGPLSNGPSGHLASASAGATTAETDYDTYDRDVFLSRRRARLSFTSAWQSGRARQSAGLMQQPNRLRQEFTASELLEDHLAKARSPLSRSAPRIGWTESARPRRRSSPKAYQHSELGRQRRVSTDDDIARNSMELTDGIEVDDLGVYSGASTVKPIEIQAEAASGQHRRIDNRNYSSPQHNLSGSPQFSRSSELITGSLRRASPVRPYSQLVKQTLLNPSRSVHCSMRMNAHLRRWEHIYPISRPLTLAVDWASLCVPACLPIGTDVLPTTTELAEQYQEHVYTVSPSDELMEQSAAADTSLSAETLLKEMIAQRLSQGFQLIDGSQLEHSLAHRSSSTRLVANIGEAMESTFSVSHALSDARTSAIHPRRLPTESTRLATPSAYLHQFAANPHYLTMGHHIHRLVYDPVNRNVEVKRYVRRLPYAQDPIVYQFSVWPKARDQFEHKQVAFTYPHASVYNWNYLDHLVAGYQEEMTEALRFWRTRFILIPHESWPGLSCTVGEGANPLLQSEESLNEEELRLSGFSRFLEQFERVRWTPRRTTGTDRRARRQPINSLGIVLTTFSTISFLENEASIQAVVDVSPSSPASSSRRFSSTGTPRLQKDSKLAMIASAIKDPHSGVRMRDRWWHLRLFHDVFLGSEFIDWLLRNFDHVESRQDAVEFGNELMEHGLFEHCSHRHRLLDGHYFYRLQSDFIPSGGARSWLQRAIRILPTDVSPEGTESSDPSPPRVSSTFEAAKPHSRSVELSRRMIIDVDQQGRSDRQETAILHYDVVHNSRNCYHFQLNWLGCTAHLIEDLLQTWARTAEKCGLRLVEAPVDQERPEVDDNPFQAPVDIKLVVPPPSTSALQQRLPASITVPDTFFIIALVKHFGFILDVEADAYLPSNITPIYSYHHRPYRHSQYVHRSGVAFVQICKETGSLLWVNNRLYTSHLLQSHHGAQRVASQGAPQLDPDALRMEFTRFCQNESLLQQFWISTAEALLVSSDATSITADGPGRVHASDILDSMDVLARHR